MVLRRISALFILILFFSGLIAQTKYTISGNVSDLANGENLPGALIFAANTNYNVICNSYGFYSLSLPAGNYEIVISLIGFNPRNLPIKLYNDLQLNIGLKELRIELDNISVYGNNKSENINSTLMGSLKINPKSIENVPVLFGERDLIKTMQLMPGISSAGEGNTGYYVRGGGIDQNLIMLDEATIYNATHLLGFFSVFNSDAIKDMTLMKGAIPAEYGSRASSVLDVRMKEGNLYEYQTVGNIGLISSNLSVEGPIIKEKSSFILSARRTYADLFLNLAPEENVRDADLYFYDINMKANIKLDSGNRLYLSAYFGRDKFLLDDEFGFEWGSMTATARLNHKFSNKLFSNSSAIINNYSCDIDISGNNEVIMGSGIKGVNFKQDFSYYHNSSNTIKFGANFNFHKIVPGEISANPGSLYNSLAVKPRNAIESVLYLSNNQTINSNISISYGLRLAFFTNVGPGEFYNFDTSNKLYMTDRYDNFELVKTQGGLEPRFSFNYLLNSNEAVKFSYSRINQFIHTLSNSTSTTPTDVWLPSSNNVKPQISDQFAVGYFRNFNENKFEFSVELYYKNLQNQIEYKNGAELIFNSTVEAELVFGRGWAYGTELLLGKNYGRLKGWIAYTISKSIRQFDLINNGNPFPARQDRLHDATISLNYEITEKLQISSVWVYNTGNAVTFPNGKYIIEGRTINYYTARNGYRMPDYHRLDLGLVWIRKQTEKFVSSWTFSVYNAYNRENAYFISFRQNDNNPEQNEAVQISLFKFIPSISYKFKFK